jgi:hypothetical protein
VTKFESGLFSSGPRRVGPNDSSVTCHTTPEISIDDPLASARDRDWQQALLGLMAAAEQQLAVLRDRVAGPDPRPAVEAAVGLVRAAADLLDRVDAASSTVAAVTAARREADQFYVSATEAGRAGVRGRTLRWILADDPRARWAACGPVLWSTPLVLERVFAVAATAFENEAAKILWLNLFGTFLRELKTALRGLTGRW